VKLKAAAYCAFLTRYYQGVEIKKDEIEFSIVPICFVCCLKMSNWGQILSDVP
jgi:hypothetical protein